MNAYIVLLDGHGVSSGGRRRGGGLNDDFLLYVDDSSQRLMKHGIHVVRRRQQLTELSTSCRRAARLSTSCSAA